MGIDKVAKQREGGILIRIANVECLTSERQSFNYQFAKLGIGELLETTVEGGPEGIRFRLNPEFQKQCMPAGDTLQLCEKLQLDTMSSDADLEREILLAMLVSPVTFDFPSYSEFAASVRIRKNIVKASRLTALAFHTSKIERPTDCWTYTEESGFTVLPGKSLIESLRKATQPEVSGELYAFSCYRATEYVILLGIAQELAQCNPVLLQKLQQQWESRAIVSGQFHDVFTREYGSMSEPLPSKYYVPGDRLWFRNPDQLSAEVIGYEGSWVFYLGGGLFSNFWKRDKPYTLSSKCIEIYHWRSGVVRDAEGNLQMDETIVDARVRATMGDPEAAGRIVDRMMRLRDPQGTFAEGGCIDASREYPRWVYPGTSDLVLPEN